MKARVWQETDSVPFRQGRRPLLPHSRRDSSAQATPSVTNYKPLSRRCLLSALRLGLSFRFSGSRRDFPANSP